MSYTNVKVCEKTALSENRAIKKALKILKSRICNKSYPLTCSQDTRDFLSMSFVGLDYEVFKVMFLDQRYRVIEFEEMFRGTINGASVYPREVVKKALEHNAAAVIFAHNHPSGIAEPSQSDERITKRLKDALALVDIRVLDHFVVGNDVISFSEKGLI